MYRSNIKRRVGDFLTSPITGPKKRGVLMMHNFCDDMTCPCHEDSDNIQALGDAVQSGLASVGDADRIYHSRTV